MSSSRVLIAASPAARVNDVRIDHHARARDRDASGRGAMSPTFAHPQSTCPRDAGNLTDRRGGALLADLSASRLRDRPAVPTFPSAPASAPEPARSLPSRAALQLPYIVLVPLGRGRAAYPFVFRIPPVAW